MNWVKLENVMRDGRLMEGWWIVWASGGLNNKWWFHRERESEWIQTFLELGFQRTYDWVDSCAIYWGSNGVGVWRVQIKSLILTYTFESILTLKVERPGREAHTQIWNLRDSLRYRYTLMSNWHKSKQDGILFMFPLY